jgi:anti-sigma28 factor (negative regulator of flagellin synthesis)
VKGNNCSKKIYNVADRMMTKEGKNKSAAESTRGARLQAIKEAIESGTYVVDNGKLADSLINDLLWEKWQKRQCLKSKLD